MIGFMIDIMGAANEAYVGGVGQASCFHLPTSLFILGRCGFQVTLTC